jgi:hypothetical protein
VRRLAQQVKALERQVQRALAGRLERLTVVGPAMITVEPGTTVEVVRKGGTRIEVERPALDSVCRGGGGP